MIVMIKKHFLIISLIFSVLICADAYASDYNLGRVIVSATKTQEYQANVGSATTVITSEEIRRTGKSTVLEVLQDAPGVSITPNGSLGSLASVDIRGGKRGQTLILIDGVEVYDPIGVSGDFDFGHLTTDNIERIEIVRGPQSTLYGSDAMAGVINIITVKGKGENVISASAEAGSHKTFKESVSCTGTRGDFNYSASFARLATEGISKARDGVDKDGYENTTVSTRLGVNVFDDAELFLVARYINSESEIDDGAYQDDPNRLTASQHLSGKLELQQQLTEQWDYRIALSVLNTDRQDSDPADSIDTTENEYSRYRGNHRKVEWQNNFSIAGDDIQTIGYEYEQEQGASYANGAFWWSNSQSDKRKTQTKGYYYQSQLNLWEQLHLIAGLRTDDHSTFGAQTTYKTAAAYLIETTGTRVQANYATAFRAPNLYQLYNPIYGNTLLAPEKSKGFDLGAAQDFLNRKVSCSLTYFQNSYRNLISSDPVTWQFVNINRGKVKGVELETSIACTADLKLGANYAYIRTKDKDTGNEFGRRPENQFAAYADWQYSQKGNLYLSGRYIGARMDAPAFNNFQNKKYVIMDISTGYDISDNLKLSCRVDNLFDIAYEPVRGYSGMDRSLYVGVKGIF